MTNRLGCLVAAVLAMACEEGRSVGDPTGPAGRTDLASHVTEPANEPRPRVVPFDTPADVRSALRGATGSIQALWTMVDPDRGLDVYVTDDRSTVHLCRAEDAVGPNAFPYLLDSGDRWTCNEDRTRCTSVDMMAAGSGYSFHFRPGQGDAPMRLAAIVRYGSRRVPATDPAPVAAFVAASGSVCRLRAAVREAAVHAPADADMPAELWFYRHPLVGADDDTPEGEAIERRLCGAEARHAAATLLRELSQLRDPADCGYAPLSCTYSAPLSERRLFARVDDAGRAVPWAVADLSSLPTETQEVREQRDVAAFVRRAKASPCP